MAINGYLKVPDIDGESKRAEHEEEIDFHGVKWGITRAHSSSSGSGRTQSSATINELIITKYVDAASVYLAMATLQGISFDEIILYVRKDSGDTHLDYLKITMSKCVFTNYSILNDGSMSNDGRASELIEEQLGIVFEKINYIYTVQEDDHSAGAEHEQEFDVVAQV